MLASKPTTAQNLDLRMLRVFPSQSVKPILAQVTRNAELRTIVLIQACPV